MKVELTGNRRTFMKSAAVFSGLAALFGIVKPTLAKPEAPSPEQEQPAQGYRLTEHIRRYYETARL
jgi:hypothetical protein